MLGSLFGYFDLGLEPGIPQMASLPDSSPIKDALIVSFHVDSEGSLDELSAYQTFHVGVSIFDTRDLVIHDEPLSNQPFGNQPLRNPGKAIRTYHFAAHGYQIDWETEEHYFGQKEREILPLKAIGVRLRWLVKGRRYILAGHNPESNIKFLRSLHEPIVTEACYILDVAKVTHLTMLPGSASDLGMVMGFLHLTPVLLCTAAGTHALNELRTLLMCAVRDGRGKFWPWARSRRVAAELTCDALDHLIQGR